MTQAKILRNLHKLYNHDNVEVFRKVAERVPSIKAKYVDGKLWFNTEFNFEETKEIYKEFGANELQIILLEENWEDTAPTDVYTIKGTQEFLIKFEENPEIQCCNTCKYLRGKVFGNKMPRPYCSLYEKYLETFNAKVYEDYCSSYTFIKLPKPRQWFKDNAPRNLNIYGEIDTVNGIKTKDLQGQRKADEPIKHVGQIGF